MSREAHGFVPLDPLSFGLAAGLALGGFTLILGLSLPTFVFRYGMGHGMVGMMTAVYPGYILSYVGAFIAGIWSFLKGFVGGSVVAWLYNKLI